MAGENGDYVPWTFMRTHLDDAGERDLRINTLEAEVKHLTSWRVSVENIISNFMDTQDTRHAENQKALTKVADTLVESNVKQAAALAASNAKQSKMWGIGLGVLGFLQIALIVIGLVIAFNKG